MKAGGGRPKSFVRAVAWLASGTAVGQAVVLVASPLVTRLYAPEDFGFLALYTASLGVLVVVVSLRYHLAIPLPEDEVDAHALLLGSGLAVVAVTTVVAISVAIAGERLLELVGAGGLAPYVWLVPIGLLGAGVYQVLSAYAIRLGAVRALATTKVTQGIALVATQVALGYAGLGAVGLMVGDAVGKSAGSGLLARLVGRFDRGAAREAWGRLGAVLVRYRRFPLVSTGSALLNSVGLAAPAVMLLSGYGAQEAGWYALAMRALGVPIALLGNSFSQVYTSTAAERLRGGHADLAPLYAQTARRLFLVAVPIAAVVVWLGPDVFAFAFSEVWRPAGEFSRALAPMFAIQLVATPLSQTLNLLERQRTQLAWDGLRLGAVVGVLAWAIATDRTVLTAVTALSAVMAATYLLLFALGWAAVRSGRDAP